MWEGEEHDAWAAKPTGDRPAHAPRSRDRPPPIRTSRSIPSMSIDPGLNRTRAQASPSQGRVGRTKGARKRGGGVIRFAREARFQKASARRVEFAQCAWSMRGPPAWVSIDWGLGMDMPRSITVLSDRLYSFGTSNVQGRLGRLRTHRGVGKRQARSRGTASLISISHIDTFLLTGPARDRSANAHPTQFCRPPKPTIFHARID